MDGIFYDDASQYRRDLDFLNAAIEENALGLCRIYGKPMEYCRNWIKKKIGKNGSMKIRDPEVELLTKDKYGDRKLTKTTYSKYIKAVENNHLIISPSMTAYQNKEQNLAFTVVYLKGGVANRSKHKGEAFAAEGIALRAEQDGDMTTYADNMALYDYKWNQQNNDKVMINGLSGAQSSKSTILYVPTIHPTLTSICRSASGYANSNNERILSGNRHYWSIDIIEANFLSIARLVDREAFAAMMDKYNLKYPTGEEVFEMAKRSSKHYFAGGKIKRVLELANALDPIERAAVMYTSDLFHVKELNPEFMRVMMDEMSYVSPPVKEYEDMDMESAMGDLSEDAEVLVAYLCSDLLSGGKLKDLYKRGTPEDKSIVTGTARHLSRTIHKYADFFRCVFKSKIMPHTLANLPNMVRRATVLSDTDSAVYTVQDWREWYAGEGNIFTEKAISGGHVVSYMTSTSIIHILATMSKNMGVADEDLFMYTMKSEYYFPIFGLTGRAKTYFASILGQEGQIFTNRKEETKGAVLKGSTAPRDIIKHATELRGRILDTLTAGNTLNLKDILTEVADLERDVLRRMQRGDRAMFNTLDIKPASSYSQEPEKSNYYYYTLWDMGFSDTYGSYESPPYKSVRVKLTVDTKGRFNTWLDEMENRELAGNIRAAMDYLGKDKLGSIALPISAVQARGIPKELQDVMDYREVLSSVMSSHYATLESINWYFNDNKTRRLVSDIL